MLRRGGSYGNEQSAGVLTFNFTDVYSSVGTNFGLLARGEIMASLHLVVEPISL